jgi:hypothetical protein
LLLLLLLLLYIVAVAAAAAVVMVPIPGVDLASLCAVDVPCVPQSRLCDSSSRRSPTVPAATTLHRSRA